jgi:queuine tRNA-ribosyltransferase
VDIKPLLGPADLLIATKGRCCLSEINVAYYQRLMCDIRDALSNGTFESFAERTHTERAKGDVAPR